MNLKSIFTFENFNKALTIFDKGMDSFNKGLQDFGEGMDSMNNEMSRDIEKSNRDSKSRELKNKENLKKIWG